MRIPIPNVPSAGVPIPPIGLGPTHVLPAAPPLWATHPGSPQPGIHTPTIPHDQLVAAAQLRQLALAILTAHLYGSHHPLP